MVSNINICFFGLNRSLSCTIDSLNKYVFKALAASGFEFRVYGCFSRVKAFTNSRSGESGAPIQDNEENLIQFEAIKYVDQDTLDDSIAWDKVFEYGDTYSQILESSDLPRKDSTAKNIFRSLWCLKSSFSLIPQERSKFPTIFLRPDLEILSDIDWSFYLELLAKKPRSYSFGSTDGVAVLPSWHSWDGLNDRFAVCSPGNASIAYANRFDSLLSYINMSRHPLHPETYLLHVLQSARVEVLPTISTCMARIRANGQSQAEDFGQGGKSFSLQIETLSCLHKLLQEKTKELEVLRGEPQDSVDGNLTELSQKLSSLRSEANRKEDELGGGDISSAKIESSKVNDKLKALLDENSELKFQLLDKIKASDQLSKQLADTEEILSQTEEISELTMTQLLQVQEELEHYYLMSLKLKNALSQYSSLKDRSLKIIANLASEVMANQS